MIISTLAFIAMALSFMAQIAPLWAKQADGTPMVICSSFGEQTILIDENGNKLPNLPNFSPHRNHCALCFVMGGYVILPDAPLMPVIQVTSLNNANAFHPLSPYHALNINAHGIRAPPVKS
tara:strand:- start:661 stop:1023 length:363 start_codon:yes stop_codon:yes gene_type:complete